MFYHKTSNLQKDFKWLCYETTLEQFTAFRISDYEYSQFNKRLERTDINDTLALKFYDDILDSFDLEKKPWENSVNNAMLPMIALIPEAGMRIIIGLNSDGSYNTLSSDGVERFTSFPKKSKFKKLRLKQKDTTKISASQMFRQIAFKQKKYIIYAIIASLSINILALGTSFYALQVYDRVIPTNGVSTLISLTIGVFIAILLEMMVKFSRSAILDQASKNMDVEYSCHIFNRFLSIRGDTLPRSVGSLSSKLQGYATVRGFISSFVLFMFTDFPFVFLFLWVIVLIGGWQIAQIIVFFLLVTITIGFLFKTKIEKLIKSSTLASHKKMGLLVETIQNAHKIKATNAKWGMINKWGKLTEDAIDDDINIKHYTDISTYLSVFSQQISYIFVVAVGAYIISTEATITMGGLIAITILSNKVFAPIGQIPNLFVSWGRAKVAIKDLNGIYELDRENEGIQRPIVNKLLAYDIKCEHLKFGYDKNNIVLNLPRFSIKQGEKVAILGTIGAGKSTLLKILSGIYKPNEGKVYLGGIDLDHISRENIAKNIGYLAQETKLFSGTLRENLTVGLVDISDEQILLVAKDTGLMPLIAALPKGLDTEVPEGGDSVSGGQKQLIALTRMMLSSSKIILLDEPTANMDEANENHMIKLFKQKVSKEQTVVLVTHKPALLSLVDRIVILTPQGIAIDDKKEVVLEKLKQSNQTKKGGSSKDGK